MIGKGVLAFGALSRPCSCLERIVSFDYNEGGFCMGVSPHECMPMPESHEALQEKNVGTPAAEAAVGLQERIRP